jgi:hypothetical protein
MSALSWMSLEILIAPAVAAAATIAGHVLASRAWPMLGIYRAQLLGIATGAVLLALITVPSLDYAPDSAGRAAANVLIYLCFCYVYFHFNNMGETARRIRLLRELVSAGRPLALAEITERYGANEIVERRLGRLLAAGQVREVAGRYIVADRSVYLMAQLVNLAHRLVFGRPRPNPLEDA